MIYRGQSYGADVGEWWTTSLAEAESFARSRGGNRTWVILSLDEATEDGWLKEFLMFERGGDKGDWYRIPIDRLRNRWRAVTICKGSISMKVERGGTT